ncbi:MAG: hypothetical protein HYZ17_12110 [Betaproteobacteria bacterium]|nr:hypothetical protein [Betaproteobacteria bacterium]
MSVFSRPVPSAATFVSLAFLQPEGMTLVFGLFSKREEDTARDPLAEGSARAARWAAALPRIEPATARREVLEMLAERVERVARLTPERLAGLLTVDESLDWLRLTLATQYVTAARGTGSIEEGLWRDNIEFANTFTQAYQRFFLIVEEDLGARKWRVLLPRLSVRMMQQMMVDAKFRLFRFERWIPAKWQTLHKLYRLCAKDGSAEESMTVQSGGEGGTHTSVASTYLQVLMLQLVNAGNLPPPQLEWVARQLPVWVQTLGLKLSGHMPTNGGFYVDPGSTSGLHRLDDHPPSGALFFQTASLEAALYQQRVETERELARATIRDRDRMIDLRGRLEFLDKLATQFAMNFHPLTRRGNREDTDARVRIVVGFQLVCKAVKEQPRAEPFPDSGGSNDGYTVAYEDVAASDVYGFFQTPGNTVTPAGPVARGATNFENLRCNYWRLVDRSVSGVRVLAPANEAECTTIGTLVAIHVEGESSWLLGIVRRLRHESARETDIGIEVVAHNLVQVQLQAFTPTAEGYKEAETITGFPHNFYGLYLPAEESSPKRKERTLIIPREEFDSHKPEEPLSLVAGQFVYTIGLRHPLEKQADWAWAALEVLNRKPVPEP